MTYPRNGLDPEFLVVDGEGYIVPAEKFLDTGDPEADVAYDGVAVEVRPRPSRCLAGFGANVRELMWAAMRQYRLARAQGRIPRDARPTFAPLAMLREEDLMLKSAHTFGCSPSLVLQSDAKSLVDTTPHVDPFEYHGRSAGFHVHYDLGRAASTNIAPMMRDEGKWLSYLRHPIQLLDTYLGLLDVMMCHRAGWTEQSRARRLTVGYGVAGEFRVAKSGGEWRRVEYRTMSPWPLSHPMWTWWVQSAARYVIAKIPGTFVPPLPYNEVQKAINECDNEAAQSMWERAIRVLYRANLGGHSENDALAKRNLRYVVSALRHGGHRFWTCGWGVEKSWFANGKQSTRSIHRQTPREYLRFLYRIQHDPNSWETRMAQDFREPMNVDNQTIHDLGAFRCFPTGPQRLIDRKLVTGRKIMRNIDTDFFPRRAA